MLKYYIIFAALVAAAITGCTVDTRTTPTSITIDQAQALDLWEFWMLRRAALQRELDDPETDPLRRLEVMDLLKAENDLIAYVGAMVNVTGGEVAIDLVTPDNLDRNVEM